MRVFIGYDDRESEAYRVAEHSLRRRASIPVDVTPLKLANLELCGLLRRPRSKIPKGRSFIIAEKGIDRRIVAAGGQLWDDISQAPMSTQFACSRFLTPLLCQSGWALFVDCDVVFLGDIADLAPFLDPRYALLCVKHGELNKEGEKMDGQLQVRYRRKNWSSFMLFNCDHPANFGLTLEMINRRPGRDLHAFCWLDDSLIGELPAQWNWLVNVTPRPKDAKVAHFTLGGPWLPNWTRHPHDDIFMAAAKDLRS